MAPDAKIELIEANNDSLNDLLSAVQYASSQSGVSVVSMSWGTSEFSGETSYNSYFTTPSGHTGVTFVASSGDSGAGALWPAISTNVLSVGGTTLNLSGSYYSSETAWSDSGGGKSIYQGEASYQEGVQTSAPPKIPTWPTTPIPTPAWPFTIRFPTRATSVGKKWVAPAPDATMGRPGRHRRSRPRGGRRKHADQCRGGCLHPPLERLSRRHQRIERPVFGHQGLRRSDRFGESRGQPRGPRSGRGDRGPADLHHCHAHHDAASGRLLVREQPLRRRRRRRCHRAVDNRRGVQHRRGKQHCR